MRCVGYLKKITFSLESINQLHGYWGVTTWCTELPFGDPKSRKRSYLKLHYGSVEYESMTSPPTAFSIPEELPVLPLRDMVVFPYMVLPLFVARERSIAAIEDALAGDRLLLVVAQRDASIENPDNAVSAG